MSGANSRAWVLLDLAAGLVAITAVVGVSVRATFVGSDLRALFAMTAAAFFLAGFARGRERRLNAWVRGLLVSCPGLLGTAALIVNDGLHRLPIPIAVSVTAILFTIAGLETRGQWRVARARALAVVALCVFAGALEIVLVRQLVVRASLHRVNRAVQEFSLATFAGDTLRSTDLRGKVVVLAYWASWCLPCRWEMPELRSAFAKVRNDSSVVFLAVDAGWGGETIDSGRRALTRGHLDVPAAFDSGGAAAALGVHALPTVVILDPAGRVRFEHYGYDRSERAGALYLDCIRALEHERLSRRGSA